MDMYIHIIMDEEISNLGPIKVGQKTHFFVLYIYFRRDNRHITSVRIWRGGLLYLQGGE